MVFASLLGFALIAAGCVNWPMFRHDPGHSGDNQFSTSTVSGVLKWKMPFPKGCMVVSSPTVDGSEKIYIGAVCGTGQSQTGGFCAINPNGTSAWCNTHMQGWPQYSSAAIEAAVYIGGIDSGKAGLIAIDPNSGNLLWTLPAPVIYSPPTFSLGLSSVTGQVETTIYIGAIDGNLTRSIPVAQKNGISHSRVS